jgi:hypothetical protein
LGLGPDSGSNIVNIIESVYDSDDPRDDTVLSRIFSQNLTSQNFMSLLLTRSNDSAENFQGELTISEIIPGLEGVTSMPKLPVDITSLAVIQHFTVTSDPDPVVVNGHQIRLRSVVDGVNDGSLVAVFDSGFTFPQIPREMADTIYGELPGALFNPEGNFWTLPCNQSLNVTFSFGGQTYPIHPLDLNTNEQGTFDVEGVEYCVGFVCDIIFSLATAVNLTMPTVPAYNAWCTERPRWDR